MNQAAYLPLYTEQNADYNQQFQLRQTETPDDCNPESGSPVDIRGYTAKMQIRVSPVSDVVVELTEVDGIEIEDDTQGRFIVNITSEKTALLTGKKYVYDLFFTDTSGIVLKMLYGTIDNTIAVTSPV